MAARVITRGDDLGSFKTANQAILDACRNGVLKNVSVMLPTSYIAEAVEMLGDVDVCFGLHLTVTSEWQNVRWKPLLPADEVPCLVCDDGTFKRNANEIHDGGTVFQQVMAECKAQLARARELGFKIDYMDEHMGFGWIFEGEDESIKCSDLIRAWCKEEAIIYHRDIPFKGLPVPEGDAPWIERYIDAFRRLSDDDLILTVGHPAYDTDEMREVHHLGEEPGQQGIARDLQRQMFMHPGILELHNSGQLQAIKFTEVS